MLSRYWEGEWQEASAIVAEDWSANYPVMEAPAISVQNENVMLAWYSEAQGEPHLKVAFSQNNGQAFDTVVELAKGRTTGKVAAQWLDDTTVLLAFAERQETGVALRVAIVDENGNVLHEKQVAFSTTGKLQNPPELAKQQQQVLLAWKWSNDDYKMRSLEWEGGDLQVKDVRF